MGGRGERGGYSQEIALNSLWKYLSDTEKLKNKSRSAGQHLFFASRSIFHCRKKHTAITTFSTMLPRSISAFRRGFLRAGRTEPSTARLYCAWHILEGSHCGMWRVFSFHPSKKESLVGRARHGRLLGGGGGGGVRRSERRAN